MKKKSVATTWLMTLLLTEEVVEHHWNYHPERVAHGNGEHLFF